VVIRDRCQPPTLADHFVSRKGGKDAIEPRRRRAILDDDAVIVMSTEALGAWAPVGGAASVAGGPGVGVSLPASRTSPFSDAS